MLLPSKIKPFVASAGASASPDGRSISLHLQCPRCSGSRFQIIGSPQKSELGSTAGEIVLCDPISIKCVGCGLQEVIFDRATDGYNAVIEGEETPSSRDDQQPWVTPNGDESYAVVVEVAYPSVVDEVDASKRGNAFSSIAFKAFPGNGQKALLVEAFETA